MKQILSLLTTISIIGCSPKYNIQATFNGFSNDTIILSYMSYADYINNTGTFKKDTLILVNNKMKTSLDLTTPMYVWIDNLQYHNYDIYHGISGFHPAGKVTLVLEQDDKVNIEVTQADGYVISEVKGSYLCNDISEVDNILRPIHKQRYETGDEINRIVAKQQMPSLEIRQEMTALGNKIKDIQTDFITSHLADEIAAYLLLNIKLTDAVNIYEQMDKTLFSTTFKPVEEKLVEVQTLGRIKSNAEKKLTPGNVAPDFTLTNIDGEEFILSSLNGKWVILDFWGTWCGWCIKGFPKLKEYYTKYNATMEIVAINCIDSDKRWRESVQKYSLPFINIKDNNKVSAQYAISGYPTKIIITPEGLIHKVFVGESNDFYKELDKIMK